MLRERWPIFVSGAAVVSIFIFLGTLAILSRPEPPKTEAEPVRARQPAIVQPVVQRDVKPEAPKPKPVKPAPPALSDVEREMVRIKAADLKAELDPASMRVGNLGKLKSVSILQVVDETTMLCQSGDETFFLTGASTTGLVDGRDFRLNSDWFCYVAGTQAYTTAIGSRKTVFVLTVLDSSKLAVHIKALREALQQMREDRELRKTAGNGADRRWLTLSGSAYQGEFVRLGEGTVIVKDKSQGEVEILSGDLPYEDVLWVGKLVAQRENDPAAE